MQRATILCLLIALCATTGAQTEQPGVFHESATGLTMRFPVELLRVDAEKAIVDGHLAVFGSMQNQAKEHELAARCMKPLLLAELPAASPAETQSASSASATLLLFEFLATKECKAGFKYKDEEAVAGGIAQTAIQLPGATPLSPPLWFDCGKQKLHITFAAVGLQNASPEQPNALITVAAMKYHGHILGWLISANHLNTFNDLTKTSIELDDGHTYPLVPFNLDDHLRMPINMIK